MDALQLMFDAQKQTKEEIATVKADVIDLKEKKVRHRRLQLVIQNN